MAKGRRTIENKSELTTRAVEMYTQQNGELKAIGDTLGITASTVYNWLKKAGTTMRPKGRPKTKVTTPQ